MMAVKVAGVDGVERVVQGEIGAIHGHRHEVIHREAGALQRALHAVHHQARFGLRSRGRVAGARIDADVAGNVQRVADASREFIDCQEAEQIHGVGADHGGGKRHSERGQQNVL